MLYGDKPSADQQTVGYMVAEACLNIRHLACWVTSAAASREQQDTAMKSIPLRRFLDGIIATQSYGKQ